MSHDPADIVLADDHWRVIVAPAHGMLIRSAVDVPSGAAALWRKPAPRARPASRALSPPGPASIDTFWDVFAGGWFPMFPAAGFTGELDGAPTLFHGELNRLPWEVVDRGPTWIEARVETVRSPFAVQRRVAVDRGELRVETAIANVGAAPASYVYGEHPCLWRTTFAGGRLLLSFAYDDWDMLAVEPVSAPGRGVEDAVAGGSVRTLDPGRRVRTGLAARWHQHDPG